MKITKKIVWKFYAFIITLFFVIILTNSAHALKNPAAVYCTSLGYDYDVETWIDGGQIGLCKLPNNQTVEAWAFLKGKVGKEYSYCTRQGYKIKTIYGEKCSSIYSSECAACIVNGEEVEVTKLMNLNFEEGECGDEICAIGENFGNCPQDCPSGSEEGYCDAIMDGICDQDCKTGEDVDCKPEYQCGNKICEPNENSHSCAIDCIFSGKDNYCDALEDDKCDPDCKVKIDPDCIKNYIIIGIILILVVVVGLIIYLLKRRKR